MYHGASYNASGPTWYPANAGVRQLVVLRPELSSWASQSESFSCRQPPLRTHPKSTHVVPVQSIKRGVLVRLLASQIIKRAELVACSKRAVQEMELGVCGLLVQS
eukprot:3430598-Amphidinium_carterae.2